MRRSLCPGIRFGTGGGGGLYLCSGGEGVLLWRDGGRGGEDVFFRRGGGRGEDEPFGRGGGRGEDEPFDCGGPRGEDEPFERGGGRGEEEPIGCGGGIERDGRSFFLGFEGNGFSFVDLFISLDSGDD